MRNEAGCTGRSVLTPCPGDAAPICPDDGQVEWREKGETPIS
jgi:hypothetical protein